MSPSIFSYDRRDPIKVLSKRAHIHVTVRVTCIVVLGALLFAGFIRWSETHTITAEAAYQDYEQCVQDTYGVSATKFYQVYGRDANCK